ncbi:UNVERIFIED_CONTAM: hypothetical protein HDU68_011268 [Siphonaria sp. JEL0065]|nr:hypothetical protein HDU68_011268 [Siphonaria sp. JEL0065]
MPLKSLPALVALLAVVLGGYLALAPGSHQVLLSLLSPKPLVLTKPPTSPSPPLHLDESKEALSDFQNWLKSKGASFRRCKLITYGEIDEHRGIHAKKKGIKKGEVIMDIPDKIIIPNFVAASSDICAKMKKLLPDVYSLDNSHLFLSLFLIEQRDLGESSEWYHYISTLPEKYENLPINFTPAEIELLQESNLREDMYSSYKDMIHEDYDTLCGAIPEFCSTHSFETYSWARASVLTRAFSLEIDGVPTSTLIPFGDMLNHDPNPALYWTYNSTTKSAQFISTRDIEGNAPILSSYGLIGSRYSLSHYGFAIQDNPLETALVELALPQDEFLRHRCAKALGHGALFSSVMHHVQAKRDDEEFLALLGVARISVSSPMGLGGMATGGKKYVSMWNEWKALDYLEDAVVKGLSKFPHSVESDEALLRYNNTVLSLNTRNIVIVRLGEKRVLIQLRELIGEMKFSIQVKLAAYVLTTVGSLGVWFLLG